MPTANPEAVSSRCSRVVVQQSTKTLVSMHSTETPFHALTVNQFVVEPLMIPLAMIVGHEFRDSPAAMALAERNQAVRTFLPAVFLDRLGFCARVLATQPG